MALKSEPECYFMNTRKQPSKKVRNKAGVCNFVQNFEIGSARSYSRNQLM